MLDQRCALTGEEQQGALEAAHIAAMASKSDNDHIGNAILLRADLHRLYDTRLFQFSRREKLYSQSGYQAARGRNSPINNGAGARKRVALAINQKNARRDIRCQTRLFFE